MGMDENEATQTNSTGKAIIEPCSTVVRTSFTHPSITGKPPTTGNVSHKDQSIWSEQPYKVGSAEKQW